jgi:hypothetical protein
MTVRVLLSQERPTNIRLTVSPLAEALAALRFAAARWPGCSTPEDGSHSVSVVHRTTPERIPKRRDAAGGPCMVPLRRHRGRPVHGSTSPRILYRVAMFHPLRDAVPACTWPRLRAVLEADLCYRMQRLARGGTAGLFADLHPLVRLEGGVLNVETRCDAEPIAAEGELVLVPSVQCDRVVVLSANPHHPPVLIYPARGAEDPSMRGAPPSHSLRTVIDDGPLPLLLDLSQPRTVDELADRHRMHVQPVRQHLAALESAGLLVTCSRTPTRYQRSNLAGLLVSPWCEACV